MFCGAQSLFESSFEIHGRLFLLVALHPYAPPTKDLSPCSTNTPMSRRVTSKMTDYRRLKETNDYYKILTKLQIRKF